MPVSRVQVGKTDASTHADLVQRLADELAKNESAALGQPVVMEQEFVRTGLIGVKVIWDEFARVPLTDRPAVIRSAYQAARPQEYERVAFVSGYTVPEAVEVGLLPYVVEPLDVFADSDTLGQRYQALRHPGWPVIPLGQLKAELRCTSRLEAERYLVELARQMPESKTLWHVRHEDSVGQFAPSPH